MKLKVKSKKECILWYIAIIIQWLLIPLYIASMGYEINVGIYQKLKNWEYITILYYILSFVDIIIYIFFSFSFRKNKDIKGILVSLTACFINIVLLINKIKI